MNDHVWRTRRTLAGDELGSSWVDASGDEQSRRRLLSRQFPVQPWETTPGMEVAPLCDACGSTTVWRGSWECQGCAARGARLSAVLGGLPSALPREALAGVPIFSSSEGNNSTARAQWLWAVESLTSFHRSEVSAKLLLRGTKPAEVWVDDSTGEVTRTAPYLGKWHEQRMQGQAERFERVSQCGTFNFALDVTDEHGHLTSRPIRTRCDCWRVCSSCLNRRKWKLSVGMKSQRALALRRLRSETHRRYRGAEGKWSEKLITFTVPHGDGGPSGDARILVDAWQRLLRRVRTHLVSRGATRASPRGKSVPVSVPWCRALEVAPGPSGGHAHLHVWWFGPFLDVVLLRAWWGALLAEAGVSVPTRLWSAVRAEGRDTRLHGWLGRPGEFDEIPWPVVDIRAGGVATALYTQKVGIALYVTKGTETERLEPAHAASIYEVFEGTRAVQWARGWAPPKVPLKAKCVTFRRLTEDEKAVLNHSALSVRRQAKNDEKTVQNVVPQGDVVPIHAVDVVGTVLSGASRPHCWEQLPLRGTITPR